MKYLNSIFLTLTVLYSLHSFSQNQDSPWSFSANTNLISLVGENVEKNLHFGIPALSLSRHLGEGLSAGVQFSLGNVKNFSASYDYSSFDGFFRFNLVDSNFMPHLIGGYGFSVFSDGIEKEGFFPSSETSRTFFGGIGVDIITREKVVLKFQTTYRAMNENDGFDHLQHFIGLGYNFGSKDTDKDGVPDKRDNCPNVPGLKEFEGCPDTDGDQIIDRDDKCPEIPGLAEFNGCPDTDGDGVPDPEDNCPEKAGTPEMNGCPDSDQDGLSDDLDQCIEEAGPAENNGCPWPDRDHDGVPDKDDQCPDESGVPEASGCPELSPEIVNTLNELGSFIFFPANSSQILGKKTIDALHQIKEVLDNNPNGKLIISGYASSDGEEQFNVNLSVKRAEAVFEYLVSLGISAVRLEVEGKGATDPLGDNSEPKGRAINRRVQFRVKLN
jgi:OOP family OmpA-OmpF porin